LPARIISIEGIDQSGKRTQTLRLAKMLQRSGFRVKTVSFPIYDSLSGKLIEHYLKGGKNYSSRALHMLYSLNRWENLELVKGLMRKADFLIADRYIPSNLAYGVSKGLTVEWLLGLDAGLPRADLVIVLDVPVRSSFARKSKHRDIHEQDSNLLTRVNESYRKLGKKLGWKTVKGNASAELVGSWVWSVVRKRFRITNRDYSRSN